MVQQPRKRTSPLVRKSATFPFQTALACWIDLLGYGAMIAEAEFNPLHKKSKSALRRLRRFHKIVANHSLRYFRTLVINDGAAAYRDLSLRNRSVTHDFLVRSWNLFKEIKEEEIKQGFPGPRLVLASGFRMRGRSAGMDMTNRQFQSVMRRFQAKQISAEQAITEAGNIRQAFDVVPQLQANFAFTKAYVAESSGSGGGLGGSNFFVDLSIFENPLPSWIQAGPEIPWSNARLGLVATFAQVIDLPPHKHSGGVAGILDGLQVAQRLAHDPNVLESLRSAVKP